MIDPVLEYASFTTPETLQASPAQGDPSLAQLTIVVSNTKSKVFNCHSISFSFLEGTSAKDFFSDATGIGTTKPDGWAISHDGSVFTAKPDSANSGRIGSEGLAFVFSNIKVNQQIGTTYLTITEVTDSGTAETMVRLEKFPPQFYLDDLTVKPDPPLEQGDTIVLSWSGSAEATYELQYEDGDGNTVVINHPKDEPNQPLPATGNYEIDSLQKDTTFYLTATVAAPAGDDPLAVTRYFPVAVEVPSVRIKSFSANMTVVYGANNNVAVTLTWETIAAHQVTLNGNLVNGNSATVIINETTQFTLGATGKDGPVYADLTIAVKDINLVLSWNDSNGGANPLCLIATFGANPGVYSLDFSVFAPGRIDYGAVTKVVEGISQIVTVVGHSAAFFDSAEVVLTGFSTGPITASYRPF